EVAEGEMCCGSAGIYNLTHPRAARELGDQKAANVAATKADLLVTSNPGCLLQITDALSRRGQHLDTAHFVQVLDASLMGKEATTLADAEPVDAGPVGQDSVEAGPAHSPGRQPSGPGCACGSGGCC